MFRLSEAHLSLRYCKRGRLVSVEKLTLAQPKGTKAGDPSYAVSSFQASSGSQLEGE